MSSDRENELAAKLAEYKIELPESAIPKIAEYAGLLWEWNEKLNLTRHTDMEKFVTRDVVDSIQLCNELAEGEEVMDLGTGGGVPGILIAILRPDLVMSLCESVGKKAKVVDEIVQSLDLNVAVFNARLEDILDDFRFDTVVTRAVGPLWKICHWLDGHWLSVGRLLAVKGPNWPEERKEARHRGGLNAVELRCIATYATPGTEIESVILKLWGKGQPER